MSLHMRTSIRAAIMGALANLPTTKQNVFASRATPTGDDKLPAILVYTRAERSAFDAMGADTGRPLERQLSIWVVGCCRTTGGAPPDDTLDRICAEAEVALAASQAVAGLLLNFELVSTEFDVPTDAADKRAGRVGMTWRGTYRTAAGEPTTPV